MTREQFVASVKLGASDAAVRMTTGSLVQPMGRRPSKEAIELASWYRDLKPEAQSHVQRVVRQAAESAVFGVLAILDGVRAVEESGPKGEFELVYRKGEDRVLLNDPNAELLHDTFSRFQS
jgi:hypothetical protein